MLNTQAEFLKQRVAQFNIRPLRFGFIVNRQTPPDTISELINLNTSLWGGKYNLFIPTDGTVIREDWWRILLYHDPDILMLVGEVQNELLTEIYKKVLPFQLFIWGSNSLKDILEGKHNARPVLIDTLIRDILDKSGTIPPEKSKLKYPVISPGDFKVYFETLCGSYRDDSPYLNFIQEHLGADTINCNPKNLSDYLKTLDLLEDVFTPLDFSEHKLTTSYQGFTQSDFGLIVSDGSIDDRFLYHALRWVHSSRVCILPKEFVEKDEDIKEFTQWYSRSLRSNYFNLMSSTLDMEFLKDLREKIRVILPERDGFMSKWCIDIKRCNFEVYAPSVIDVQKDQFISVEGRKLSYEVPLPNFAESILSDPRWVHEIDLSPSFGNKQGFVPSMFPDLNLLLSGYENRDWLNIWGSSARIARGKIARPSSKRDTIGIFQLPAHRNLIKTACENAGFQMHQTNSSYFEGIIRLIGSIQEAKFLQDTEIQQIFRVKRLIQGQALEASEIFADLRARVGSLDQFSHKVNSLANKQILLRGYNLSCPTCGLRAWYELSQVHEVLNCQGCRSPFHLSIDLKFAFRLNALFSERGNVSTTTILLALLLLDNASRHSLMWQTETILTIDDQETELDLLCMCDGALIVGECKNRFMPFSEVTEEKRQLIISGLMDQLNRDIQVAEKLNTDIFLFSTLEEQIPEEIVNFLSQQDKDHSQMTIRLVSPQELVTSRFVDTEDEKNHVFVGNLIKPLPFSKADDCYSGDEDCNWRMAVN